jgi:phosphate transport system permease protein
MLTWLSLLFLALFSGAAFMAGRSRALKSSGGSAAKLHSLPNYYGLYAALWAGAPAALLLLLGAMFGGRVEDAMLQAQRPAVVQALKWTARTCSSATSTPSPRPGRQRGHL